MEDLRRGARELLALVLEGEARNTPEACAWACVLGRVLAVDRRRDAVRALRAVDLGAFTAQSAASVAGASPQTRLAYLAWAAGVREVARPARRSRLLKILREEVY